MLSKTQIMTTLSVRSLTTGFLHTDYGLIVHLDAIEYFFREVHMQLWPLWQLWPLIKNYPYVIFVYVAKIMHSEDLLICKGISTIVNLHCA